MTCFLTPRFTSVQGTKVSSRTPPAGIEGIYQMADGERRVMVLIELLSKRVRVRVAPANLRKVG
jgi:transcriptional antiterminator RfaH